MSDEPSPIMPQDSGSQSSRRDTDDLVPSPYTPRGNGGNTFMGYADPWSWKSHPSSSAMSNLELEEESEEIKWQTPTNIDTDSNEQLEVGKVEQVEKVEKGNKGKKGRKGRKGKKGKKGR
ncbi:hypothetical protein SCAR479_00291 [Seiridium cardinale]|uniref:Uncharacterized protein n=1 Tax=Seiridium cardinale TaxID=138064 RepID=A0ABR2Y936_9PEZI